MKKEIFFCDKQRRRKNKGLSREKLSVSKFKVDSSRIPAPFHGFNIVHLSDLHGTLYGRHHEQLFHEIQQAGPDVVVMTGDMMDHKVEGMV